RHFSVSCNGQPVHDKGIDQEFAELWQNVGKLCPFQHDHAHDLHKVANRIELCDNLCPVRHAVNGREQAAHQDEDHHEKPGEEHGLLLGMGKVGNEKADSEHHEQIYCGKEKDHPDAPCYTDPEYDPAHDQTHS